MSIIGKTKVNKAFTLVEILLVIVVIGIILGLALPNFSNGYSRLQLNKTADDLLSISRWAQAMAISQERTYVLTFSADRYSYKLIRTKLSEGADDQDSFEPVQGGLGRMHKIPDAIYLKTKNDRIEFYPDGSIGSATIELISSEQKTTLSTNEVRGMMTKVNDE